MRRAARALTCAALLTAPLALSACGGRAHASAGPTVTSVISGESGTPSAQSSPDASSAAGGPTSSVSSTAGVAKPTPHTVTTVRPPTPTLTPTEAAIRQVYETYLLDLSRLDDNLDKADVDRVASVTTNRLAQASVRQAAALLSAQEHGVGVLRDDHVSIVMTGPSSAALTDCQDEYHFYLVNDNSGTPDPFISRGDFAGSAQMVFQNGHWLVDVFSTTHVTCAY